MRVLRANNQTDVARLEAHTGYAGCQPDVVLVDGTVCEYKSWTSGDVDNDDADEDDPSSQNQGQFYTCFYRFKQGSSTSYQQFKAYLALPQVSGLERLRYYFDSCKIGSVDALGWVKGQFRQLLYYNAAQSLTPRGEEVFNTIWNNVPLRQSLWKPSDFPNGITQTQAKEDFKDWVRDLEPKLFNFIQVR